MKKIVKKMSVFMFVTTLFTLTSCNKEKITKSEVISNTSEIALSNPDKEPIDNNDYSQLKLINNSKTLEFKTIEAYQSFLGGHNEIFLLEYIDKLPFKSFALKEKSKKSDIDNSIKSILDENGIVKIDKWFLKLDFAEEKVLACSSENENAYNLLLIGKKNEYVYEFTFDDEVLMILQDEDSLKNKSWFHRCQDRRAYHQSVTVPYHQIMNHNGVYINAKLTSEYVGWGISFKLRSSGTIYSNSNQLTSKAQLWFYLSNCSYKVRCNYSVSNYTYPTLYPTGGQSESSDGTVIFGVYNFYSGIQQLKYYDYRVKLRVDHTFYTMPPNNFADEYSYFVHIQG